MAIAIHGYRITSHLRSPKVRRLCGLLDSADCILPQWKDQEVRLKIGRQSMQFWAIHPFLLYPSHLGIAAIPAFESETFVADSSAFPRGTRRHTHTHKHSNSSENRKYVRMSSGYLHTLVLRPGRLMISSNTTLSCRLLASSFRTESALVFLSSPVWIAQLSLVSNTFKYDDKQMANK